VHPIKAYCGPSGTPGITFNSTFLCAMGGLVGLFHNVTLRARERQPATAPVLRNVAPCIGPGEDQADCQALRPRPTRHTAVYRKRLNSPSGMPTGQHRAGCQGHGGLTLVQDDHERYKGTYV
jgi:hypothetical protein